jgi:hypothetical protein
MEKPEIDKSETRTVSLPLSLWNEVEKRARESYGGKRSSYIKALVSGDLGPDSNVCQIGDNIVLDLVGHYRPAMLEEATVHMQGVNQQMFLDKIIEAVNAFMRAPCDHAPSNIVVLPKQLYVDLLKSCTQEIMEELVEKWKGLPDMEVPLGGMFGPDGIGRSAKNETSEDSTRKPHKARRHGA